MLMIIEFTKMEGCGNDYVYIDGTRVHIPSDRKSELVRALSDRHFGIGGDGVIFINASSIADFEMEMYNADGSRGEMCGNGIRCVGKYVYDHKMTDRTEITVESFGRIKYLTLYPENGSVKRVRVNMGPAILEAAEVPVRCSKEEGRALQLPDGGWAISGQFGDVDVTSMVLQALAPYCKAAQSPAASVYRHTRGLLKIKRSCK